jgi:CheY-like chemotaxis protein
MLNILCDVCEQRRLMGLHLTSVACRTCEGTGLICVEETLPCEECRLLGEPESWLVYRDTVGWLTVWRCRSGHVRTEAVGAVQTVRRRPLSLPTIDRIRSAEVDQASHILLVDDDHNYTKMLRFLLEGEGYTVTTTKSAVWALQSLADNNYDLVVLDIVMADMDGLELCRRIRATSHVPIVFLAIRSDVANKLLGLRAGADAYLTKLVDLDELLARIRALLRCDSKAETKTHALS